MDSAKDSARTDPASETPAATPAADAPTGPAARGAAGCDARGETLGGALGETRGDGRDGARGEASQLRSILEGALGEIAAWMPQQRWFAAKSAGTPQLELVSLAELAEEPLVVDAVLRASYPAGGPGAPAPALYQVPVVLAGPDAASEPGARIASAGFEGAVQLLDAARSDPGRRALLALLARGEDVAGEDMDLSASPVGDRAEGAVRSSRLLSGEQSNSSMIFELEGRDPVILKLFRVLQDGENPDVVLQGALDEHGSTRIAPMVGSVRLRAGRGAGAVTSDALLGQGFLAGVEDAWRVALGEAVAGSDFTAGARDLGAATAEVHAILADVLPTAPTSPADARAMIEQMLARLDQVAGQVSEVSERREALAAVISGAQDAQWPAMQRIHGDYHLGQVLQSPERGWILLDFEGEPMRPLSQRVLPDCPVRDVAGMLRSFDYVGGAVRLEEGHEAGDWVAAARAAFLEGYADRAGIDASDASFQALLAAFEADKAVYEVLYEASNRPAWLPIPLGALDRITGTTEG